MKYNPTFKIWKKKYSESTDKKQLYLRLIKDEENDINLCVVDMFGKQVIDGSILMVDNDNKFIVLYDNLNEDLPIKKNTFGLPELYTNAQLFTYQGLQELRRSKRSRRFPLDISDIVISTLKKAKKERDENCNDCK